MADILFGGTGGQGVLTAGKILIDVAANNGKNVSWTSEYSAEMRGGSALCRVVVSDEEIGNPYPDKLDVLCAMTEDSYNEHIDTVREGGNVIINKSLFGEIDFPGNINIYAVDATGISNDLGNPRGANLVMLGAMIKATEMIDKDQFGDTLHRYFVKKNKEDPKNITCYEQGYNSAEKM